jgi:hypothetical protein
MALFRFQVTDHLDRAIERANEPKILNFFEHQADDVRMRSKS